MNNSMFEIHSGWLAILAIYLSWLGSELSSVAWSTGGQLMIFFCFRFSMVLFGRPGMSKTNSYALQT